MIQDDLRTTARLAHLDLSEAEVSAALGDFEVMLGYFAAMRAADTDEAAFGGPLSGLSLSAKDNPAGNRLRDDNTAPSILSEALLASAPEREGRYLVVPNVL